MVIFHCYVAVHQRVYVFLYPIYSGESAAKMFVFFFFRDHLKQTSGNTWDLVMNLSKVAYERSRHLVSAGDARKEEFHLVFCLGPYSW